MWDKKATCWAGKKDWMTAAKEQNSPEDRCKLITCILNKMKLSTEHRKIKNNDEAKRFKETTPRVFGPEDITVHTREGVYPQHGKRYVASGMEVSKTMARAAAESYSNG